MPRLRIKLKEVPDWDYPEHLKEMMEEFETIVEKIRDRVRKADKNLVAGRNARTLIQELRVKQLPAMRDMLFGERDKLEALRHGMTVREWTAYRERLKAERNRNEGA